MKERRPGALCCQTFGSPIGRLGVLSDDRAVVKVLFDASADMERPGSAAARGLCDRTRQELEAYLAGMLREFTVPVEAPGTSFRSAVWAAMCEIPYGETLAYGELARRIGEPEASQAVGSACGANPIPLIIPCHRVLAAGGRIGGFGGGVDRKRWLLGLERGPRLF